jgi:hypothetical protein
VATPSAYLNLLDPRTRFPRNPQKVPGALEALRFCFRLQPSDIRPIKADCRHFCLNPLAGSVAYAWLGRPPCAGPHENKKRTSAMKIREVIQADGRICRVAVPETPKDLAICAAFSQPELDPPGWEGLVASCGEEPNAGRMPGQATNPRPRPRDRALPRRSWTAHYQVSAVYTVGSTKPIVRF